LTITKIRFALIGCGRIGERHAEHIKNLGILQAVCDVVKERSSRFAEKYETIAYTDTDELFHCEKSVDVVVICTPNGLHGQHAIAALRSGFHVLCEKPMALTVQDCAEMIAEAKKVQRSLFAIKQNRFNPPVVAVKDAIDKGLLGRIYSIQLSCFWNRSPEYYHNSWKGTKDLDGGTLFTQFSHFIDLLYWMIGDVSRAYSLTANFAHKDIIEFEDTGVVAFEFLNGALGTINYTVNSFKKNMEGSLTIFAEKGTVKIGGEYLNELEYQNVDGFEFKDIPAGNKANNYGSYVGSMSNHDKVYQNLIEVLQNNASISASAFEGLKTVEIIEKIYKSAKNLNFANVR
jgi:predicted dehydrogenase